MIEKIKKLTLRVLMIVEISSYEYTEKKKKIDLRIAQ